MKKLKFLVENAPEKKEKSTVLSPVPAEKSLPRGGLSARARGACSLATVGNGRRLLEAPARGERGRGGARPLS